MVAAVAFKLERAPGQASSSDAAVSVKILAVRPDRQRSGVGARLLRRVEGVGRGLGAKEARLDVPLARRDLKTWLGRRGYRATGGGAWLGVPGVQEATPYETLTKDLTAPEAESAPEAEPAAKPPAELGGAPEDSLAMLEV